MENELVRQQIGRLEARMVNREELVEVVGALAERIGNFAALMEARFDQLSARSPEIWKAKGVEYVAESVALSFRA
jgi:hypothetical protein